MNTIKKRPVFLDITRIRMPVAALVSILHRASGVLLFLAIPAAIYLLDRSLRSAQDFSAVESLLNSVTGKLCVLGLLWALLHHLFAGIRFLLLDVRVGLTRDAARIGAWLVCGAEALALLLIAGLLR
jgi:succinate dehydrogenase / fumarate reductase, cytochrome b subunit